MTSKYLGIQAVKSKFNSGGFERQSQDLNTLSSRKSGIIFLWAMPQLGKLVNGFSPPRPELTLWASHLRFVVHRMVLEQDFL
jgi:hypothetical protein